MATEFKLDVSQAVFPLVINGNDDEILFEKKYMIDIGNEAKLREIYTACDEMKTRSKELDKNFDVAVGQIKELAKTIINATLGDWETIWEKSRNNIFAVMALGFHLANMVKEESGGTLKRYGF